MYTDIRKEWTPKTGDYVKTIDGKTGIIAILLEINHTIEEAIVVTDGGININNYQIYNLELIWPEEEIKMASLNRTIQ